MGEIKEHIFFMVLAAGKKDHGVEQGLPGGEAKRPEGNGVWVITFT